MQDLARKFQIQTNGVSLSTTIGGRATAAAFGLFLKKKAGVGFRTKMDAAAITAKQRKPKQRPSTSDTHHDAPGYIASSTKLEVDQQNYEWPSI